MAYVLITDEEGEEQSAKMELPAEEDGSLSVSTLSHAFPGAYGLKYRNPDSGAYRGLKVDENGRMLPPAEGWGNTVFTIIFQKASSENTKRKMDCDQGGASSATKLKRLDQKKCSDLIVLGVPYKTSEEELKEYFEQFGEVLVSQIKKDFKTGKSKGFGFVRFQDYDSQVKVLSQRHHIDGRWCDVKIPDSKKEQAANQQSKKVFVGRVPEAMAQEDLRVYFEQKGEVTDVFIPRPFRSFAFVTFADGDVAQSLCGEDHIINGNSVYVSQAVPKDPSERAQTSHTRASSPGVSPPSAKSIRSYPSGPYNPNSQTQVRSSHPTHSHWGVQDGGGMEPSYPHHHQPPPPQPTHSYQPQHPSVSMAPPTQYVPNGQWGSYPSGGAQAQPPHTHIVDRRAETQMYDHTQHAQIQPIGNPGARAGQAGPPPIQNPINPPSSAPNLMMSQLATTGAPGTLASGTNQATLGMGNLNLGNLNSLNSLSLPQVIQAALSSALVGLVGQNAAAAAAGMPPVSVGQPSQTAPRIPQGQNQGGIDIAGLLENLQSVSAMNQLPPSSAAPSLTERPWWPTNSAAQPPPPPSSEPVSHPITTVTVPISRSANGSGHATWSEAAEENPSSWHHSSRYEFPDK